MVRHLGMLYNTIGMVIKDVTKVMSYRFGLGEGGGSGNFFSEFVEVRGRLGLELESSGSSLALV